MYRTICDIPKYSIMPYKAAVRPEITFVMIMIHGSTCPVTEYIHELT
jgi:hypothetical protein